MVDECVEHRHRRVQQFVVVVFLQTSVDVKSMKPTVPRVDHSLHGTRVRHGVRRDGGERRFHRASKLRDHGERNHGAGLEFRLCFGLTTGISLP